MFLFSDTKFRLPGSSAETCEKRVPQAPRFGRRKIGLPTQTGAASNLVRVWRPQPSLGARKRFGSTDELLRNVECASEIGSPDVARKASRLARLLDDHDAMQWLKFEVEGYPSSLDLWLSLRPSDQTDKALRRAGSSRGRSGTSRTEVSGALTQLSAPAGNVEGQGGLGWSRTNGTRSA